MVLVFDMGLTVVKAVGGWAKDPKWWAVVFLAWTLTIFFSDVKPGLTTMEAEHTRILEGNTALVELLTTAISQQRIQTNATIQDCIQHASDIQNSEAKQNAIDRCFAILNGHAPQAATVAK